jgi:hypothetical protein
MPPVLRFVAHARRSRDATTGAKNGILERNRSLRGSATAVRAPMQVSR